MKAEQPRTHPDYIVCEECYKKAGLTLAVSVPRPGAVVCELCGEHLNRTFVSMSAWTFEREHKKQVEAAKVVEMNRNVITNPFVYNTIKSLLEAIDPQTKSSENGRAIINDANEILETYEQKEAERMEAFRKEFKDTGIL